MKTDIINFKRPIVLKEGIKYRITYDRSEDHKFNPFTEELVLKRIEWDGMLEYIFEDSTTFTGELLIYSDSMIDIKEID